MRVLKRVDEEQGAVVVIVALLLVVIFGMLILVVDVGGLVTLRAEMVRSADSATLAAAQSCGLGDSDSDARASADQYAVSNEPSIDSLPNPVSYTYGPSGCDPEGGTVTIRYQAPLQLVFAPILGVDADRPVVAEATALWAPAGRGNPVPFVANSDGFGTTSCEVDLSDLENVPEGTRCSLMFDNDVFGGSVFGSLNLNKWNVDPGLDCSNKELGDNSHYALVGGYDGPLESLPLNFPDPTYVCSGDGLSASLYHDFEKQLRSTLVFPITQPPFIEQANKIDKFNVIGFAVLRLDDILDAHEAGGQGTTTCRVTRDFTANEPVLLSDLGMDGGCFSSTQGLHLEGNLDVQASGGCCLEGTDYAFDSATNSITWGNQPKPNVQVDFDFSVEGVCGTPPPNSSARCLVTSWVGGRIGPGGGFGEFGGLSQIRLCDEDFDSCDLPE